MWIFYTYRTDMYSFHALTFRITESQLVDNIG